MLTQLRLIKFMSEQEYVPKSKAGKWFNDRLPLLSLASHLTDYPTPKNLNYWWTFGGILTFCLLTQIITGIVLAMHYVAHADLAFASVEHIMRDVNYGWLIRYIHSNGVMFFLAVYIHIFRSLFYGSYVTQRNNMDNRFADLSSYDGSCVYGLCFALGSNEFLGSNSYHKFI